MLKNLYGADGEGRTPTPLRELEPKGNVLAAYCRKQTEISGNSRRVAVCGTAFRQQIDHRIDHKKGGSG